MLVDRAINTAARIQDFLDPTARSESIVKVPGGAVETRIERHLRNGNFKVFIRDGNLAGVVYVMIEGKVRRGRLTRLYRACRDFVDGTSVEGSYQIGRGEVLQILQANQIISPVDRSLVKHK